MWLNRFGVLAMAAFAPKQMFGFIFTAIACAIYNLVAGFVGGIEVELEAERAQT